MVNEPQEKTLAEKLEEKKDKREETPKKETRGRKKKVDKEAEAKKERLEKINVATGIIEGTLTTFNRLLFTMLPDDLKKECKPLDDAEIKELTNPLVLVLEKHNLLDFQTSPELALLMTSGLILYPRIIGFNKWRKAKKSEFLFEQTDSEENNAA